MLLVTAACGQSAPAPAAPEAPAAEAPAAAPAGGYKMFMVLRQIGDAYYDTIGNGAVAWGKANGHDVQYVAPTDYDAAAQIALIQDCIAQKPDAILCSPVSNEACEPVFKEAREAGIIVIVNEAEGMTNIDWDVEYLAPKPYAEAWIELMASKNGGEGDYACMVGSLQNTAEVARCNYAIEYAKEKYPKMNLVKDIVEPSGDTADAHLALFKELLTTYPNLRSILSAQSVAQASLAIEEAGLIGQTYCAGEAIPSEITQYVKSGAGASIVADLSTCGGALAAVAARIKDGGAIEAGMDLGLFGFDSCGVNAETKLIEANDMLVITDANIDQYNF
jgi:simple sugar transport system substrate-binding protein